MNDRLHAELWTSWASLLRSYAAAHGLNSAQHAVIEVGANEITVRVGGRWVRFTSNEALFSNDSIMSFVLNEDGTIVVDTRPAEEMDIAAERFTRELFEERS